MSDELRDWHIARERMQTGIADFIFRIAEMTLICGLVVFVERKLGASIPLASGVLAAIIALYARSRATAGMLELMKMHQMEPRRQRIFYLLIQATTAILFLGIVALTHLVVPLIADVQ